MNSKQINSLAMGGLWLCGFFVLALLVAFLAYILYKGLPVLSLPLSLAGPATSWLAAG